MKIIDHTDKEMILHFEDMCDKFIHVLSAAPTIENFQVILPVFRKLALNLEIWYGDELDMINQQQKLYDDMFEKNDTMEIDEMLNFEQKLPKIERIDREKYRPKIYEKIAEKIIKELIVSISLVISSGNRIGLNMIVKTIKSCLTCLNKSPKFLNLIHQLWQPLITCFNKTRDLHLLRICVDMTLLFTNFGRDFLRQRTEKIEKISKKIINFLC